MIDEEWLNRQIDALKERISDLAQEVRTVGGSPSYDTVTAGKIVAQQIEAQKVTLTSDKYTIAIDAMRSTGSAGIVVHNTQSDEKVGVLMSALHGPALLMDRGGDESGLPRSEYDFSLFLDSDGMPVIVAREDDATDGRKHVVELTKLHQTVEKAAKRVEDHTAARTAGGHVITGTRVTADVEEGEWRRIELEIATTQGHTLRQNLWVRIARGGRRLEEASLYAPAVGT